MANIINYIKDYGNLTFEEEEFNEVDNVIFSSLAYLDFGGMINKGEKKTLSELAVSFFKKNGKKEINNNIISIKGAIKILDLIKDSIRYKDIKIYNYVYLYSEEKQFSAIFIDYDKFKTYVSFEGTDELISGWYEDAVLACTFPVPSHKEAIKYVNSNISIFSFRKYIFGGHSKGGNLALVAGMYANPLIKAKIEKVYSNDGPGLRLKEKESIQYKKTEKKYELIIPDYSIVGILLRHKAKPYVIKSNKIGAYSHDILTWEVSDNHFIKSKLSNFSKNLDKIIIDWLNTYNDEEREAFVLNVFDIFKRCKINSLLDIKASKVPSILKLVKESNNLDAKSKKMINKLIIVSLNTLKEDTKNNIKNYFNI